MKEQKATIREGLTYDDVLLVPAYSEILPKDVNISTQFTKGIKINIPIASSAMDTVTEARLAIAIAQQGGVGVIHKNMSISEQASEVHKVKRSEGVIIRNPVTLNEDALVEDATNLMNKHGISGIPVVDKENKLKGIVTSRDLRFEKNLKLPVTDIMTGKDKLVVSEGDTSLMNAEKILSKYRIEKLPVVDKNFKLIGLITYRDITKARLEPQACKDELGRLRVGAAVGVTGDMMERITALVENEVDFVVIDTAHGHSKGVIDALKNTKKKFPKLQIVVGNIATGEAAKMLVKAGADAIKVGIGPGSICTTRVIAGIGVPQFTALQDVAEAIKGSGVPVIADGGIKYSGDIVKALAGGAQSVMLGSLFAGVIESPGDEILYEGRKYKAYRGMGSIEAMKQGSKDRYFQGDESDSKKLVPEGVVGRVPLKGTLAEIIFQLVGGIRAGMGYCGSKNISTLQKSEFIRITSSGIRESHPHDVFITVEPPNYSGLEN